MKTSELSRLSNVSVRSIRHYENKGLLRADRLENDYRDFDESAVERVKAIQLYLKLGLTTDEIGALFKTEAAEPDEYEYCEEMLATYKEKLDHVNYQIEALHGLKGLLERQIAFTINKKKTV
ncbi:MerR family transcriptional regulator [Paenibacillus elgii]|uniref:MerR family transcriptional regulator n=1 Tax=Paenibacillus elgii TaxID=189691 RepID=A0A163Y4P8_9BACL|nr:MerR family transcriptional regulator [Paenibacillus elgii]KZE78893.1 MerR family transcriptional regulator [Paenibacillus elgii]